jgi:hypothetical protein
MEIYPVWSRLKIDENHSCSGMSILSLTLIFNQLTMDVILPS